MSLISTILRSSIGKKYIMATTGALLGLFLIVHLAGNSVIFSGKEAFNGYAAKLHSLGFLISVSELLLGLVFLTHVTFAVLLYLDNLQAKPDRYAVHKMENRWLSGTTPYTGLIIFAFIVVHLFNFHFTDKTVPIAEIVRQVLTRPGFAFFYIFSLLALTLHISHGFWSLFQSFGINHPKYNEFIKNGSLTVAVAIGAIFILIPIFALTCSVFLR